MYEKDFAKLLASKKLPNYFLLQGASLAHIECYKDLLLQAWSADELIITSELEEQMLNDFLSDGSLFSSSKVLLLQNCKRAGAKPLKALISGLKDRSDLFFLFTRHESKALDSTAFGSNMVRFFEPNNDSEAAALLLKRATHLGIKTDSKACLKLAQSFLGDFFLAFCELNRFAGGEMSAKDAELNSSSANFDEFFASLFRGDFSSRLQDLLKDGSIGEIELLNMLNSSFARLFKLFCAQRAFGQIDIETVLGYRPPAQIASAMLEQSLKVKNYQAIFALLLNTELEIKKSNNPELLAPALMALRRFAA